MGGRRDRDRCRARRMGDLRCGDPARHGIGDPHPRWPRRARWRPRALLLDARRVRSVLAVHRRRDVVGRAALVRGRERRRSGTRCDVRAARAVPGRARRDGRDPRRPRRARPSVRGRLRHDRHRRSPPERLRAPRGRGADATSLRRVRPRCRGRDRTRNSGASSTPTSGSSTWTRPKVASSSPVFARARPSSCADRPRRTAPRPTAASFPNSEGGSCDPTAR